MKAFLIIAVAAIGSPASGPYTVISETPVSTMAACQRLADHTNPVYTDGVGVSRIQVWCERESETAEKESAPTVNRAKKSGFACDGCGDSFVKPENRFHEYQIRPGVIW